MSAVIVQSSGVSTKKLLCFACFSFLVFDQLIRCSELLLFVKTVAEAVDFVFVGVVSVILAKSKRAIHVMNSCV